MGKVRRLGVLTSGGDCAGLNAVIRAVTYRAVRTYGWKVFGIIDGSMGLMERPLRYRELDLDMFSGTMLREAGTFLGTVNRGDPFNFPMPDGSTKDRSLDFVDGFNKLELDALIVIGGDGSMKILSQLCDRGAIKMVGVPKTIDNDVHHTDFAVGFTTAVNVVTEALDRLQPTAASHHRVMILEVMGRDAGHIAINAAISGGADVALIPEIPYRLESIARKIEAVMREGRNHALVVVAEGVKTEDGQVPTKAESHSQVRYGGIGQYLSENLAAKTELETRVTTLGHIQRGGTPSTRDRLLASAFGVHAVDMVAEGKWGHMVAWRDNGVVEVPLEDVCIGPRTLDPDGPLIKVARGLGIYVGEESP
ncbi:ATP-dependent 6-phosphofructokinase [Roseospira navarrensis]|uniref:ATP-dependent 6-phosphofructokinase n=1 Tax=Roseospira navarrensis TaxID=140058 RepID=A0A7X1ZJ20_9PROT|nr:ATP-dependent 6-phosphofructokinase [Roseospira navarrensis]MQX38145.1 ATP-dependent 6-phosphofructokinase [Roseospira navarrensis]